MMREIIRQELQGIQDAVVRFKTLADAAARASDVREEKELRQDIAEYEQKASLLAQALSHKKDSQVLFDYAKFKQSQE